MPMATMIKPQTNMMQTWMLSVMATAPKPPATLYKPTTVPETKIPSQIGQPIKVCSVMASAHMATPMAKTDMTTTMLAATTRTAWL